MKSILVTGGAGYIGSSTVLKLLNLGYRVYVIDNLFRGVKSAFHESTYFYNIDLCDQSAVNEFFCNNKIDLVFHLAALAYVKESVEMPELYLQNNVESTRNIINACLEHSVSKIIFSSSCTLYGNVNNNQKVNEDSDVLPINPYGKSKLICENLVKQSGLNYLILRYFNVAGADLKNKLGIKTQITSNLVHTLSRAAINNFPVLINGGGAHVRDYLHLCDLINIHELALNYFLSSDNVKETINCSYGKGYSVNEAVDIFEKTNSVTLKKEYKDFRLGDPNFLVGDNSKLKILLAWSPIFENPFEEVCKSSYHWEVFYQKNQNMSEVL
jgi:UDP-glucose 4-epimerase